MVRVVDELLGISDLSAVPDPPGMLAAQRSGSHESVYLQGWTAPAKATGMPPCSRQGQRLRQGSPSILLFELVLCMTLPEVGPAAFTIAGPFHGVILASPQGLSSPGAIVEIL